MPQPSRRRPNTVIIEAAAVHAMTLVAPPAHPRGVDLYTPTPTPECDTPNIVVRHIAVHETLWTVVHYFLSSLECGGCHHHRPNPAAALTADRLGFTSEDEQPDYHGPVALTCGMRRLWHGDALPKRRWERGFPVLFDLARTAMNDANEPDTTKEQP